jgi:phenylalanyl-tRNA synthetase alpha chain
MSDPQPSSPIAKAVERKAQITVKAEEEDDDHPGETPDEPEWWPAFERELAAAASLNDAKTLRDRYLGRKHSIVASWMQLIGGAPPDQKKSIGLYANALKVAIEARWKTYAETAQNAAPAGGVDVTLPGRRPRLGHRHPLTIVRDRMEEIFTRMGFAIVEGPEVEDEWHCFDALNMPAEHPARDMQDTLYLASPVTAAGEGRAATLLRTHTSGMQIRYMETHQPPIRLIAPGRVYRRDGLDLTHSPMFTQVEGLVVGENVTLADLKGTLVAFARELFGADRKTRFRPSFFPYTEPSGELDISCVRCGGTGFVTPKAGPEGAAEGGCAMCKQTGWIEVLGSGMVHPAVFEAVGYDPETYTGFAFGVGIERLALLKRGIEDIRLFYENDLRFLEQFPL